MYRCPDNSSSRITRGLSERGWTVVAPDKPHRPDVSLNELESSYDGMRPDVEVK